MKINVLTLFPDTPTPLQVSMLGRTLEDKRRDLNLVNFRDFTTDVHHHADDTSYGGGAGMVLQIMPIKKALDSFEKKGKVIITTPQGKTFSQKMAERWADEEQDLTLICGHHGGLDQRVYEMADEIASIGDHVLTGGELPIMSMIDVTVRPLPGALGNSASAVEESFSYGLPEYPQYTRPAEFEGMEVSEVLVSGNHGKIAEWCLKEALRNTLLRRSDLLETRGFTPEESKLLTEIKLDLENRN